MSETGAMLTGWGVSQQLFVPIRDGRSQSGRNECLQVRKHGLQRSVAPAVIAVQMGIDQHIQATPLEHRLHQQTGLRRMQTVAAVDERRALAPTQHHTVGRQPATLQHGDAAGNETGLRACP